MAVDQIEQEFHQLRSAYQSEPNLKTVLDGFDNMTSFSTAWNYVQGHFEHLQLFCGSMATAFQLQVWSRVTCPLSKGRRMMEE